jgi:hypothetical protein
MIVAIEVVAVSIFTIMVLIVVALMH